MKNQLSLPLIPLPTTSEELIYNKAPDYNERMVVALKNGLYVKVKPYLEGLNNQQAKTGKLVFDRALAAYEAKKHFLDENDEEMANLSEARLDHHMRVARKRLNIDHKGRLKQAVAQLEPPKTEETGG